MKLRSETQYTSKGASDCTQMNRKSQHRNRFESREIPWTPLCILHLIMLSRREKQQKMKQAWFQQHVQENVNKPF